MKKLLTKLTAALCCAALIVTALPFAKAQAQQLTVGLDVEGAQKTLLSDQEAFTRGETVYDILKRALDSAGIAYDFPDGSYGRYIQRIGSDAAAGDYSTWWGFYLNDSLASSGISSVRPSAGDRIVIALGGAQTLYPNVTLTPRRPTAGQSVSVKLTAEYYDYVSNKTITEGVAGATIGLGGKTAATGQDGTAELTMPSAAGDYTLLVDGNSAAGIPTVVRRNIPVTVYTSLPSGDDGTGYSLDTESSIDVCASGDVTAKLSTSKSGDSTTAAIAADKTIAVRGASGDCFLSIPAGTTVTGSSSWNGGFLLPQFCDKSALSPANASVSEAVRVGADSVLTLSKPARLVIPDAHGCSVGYLDASGKFRRIASVLSSDAAPAGAGAGFEGVYDNGYDLVVYTAVLGRFAAYRDLSSDTASDAALKSAMSAVGQKLSGDTSKWAAFALSRAGVSHTDTAKQSLIAEIRQNGGNYSLSTGLSSACIVLAACGVNPADVGGVNLYEKLYNYGVIDKMGTMGPVYALIALDARKTPVPPDAKWTRQQLVDRILSYQKDDGSFAISKTLSGDTDTTAMTLIALAPYAGKAPAGAAVQKALSWLSSNQQADGGFASTLSNSTVASSESTSSVIMALSALGIDCKTDARFVKNKCSPLDGLMSYHLSDGGFAHAKGGADDTIAEEQALMALTAYTRLVSGSASLFDLTGLEPGASVPAADSAVTPAPAAGSTASGTGKAGSGSTNPHTGDSLPIPAVAACLITAALLPAAIRKNNRVKQRHDGSNARIR